MLKMCDNRLTEKLSDEQMSRQCFESCRQECTFLDHPDAATFEEALKLKANDSCMRCVPKCLFAYQKLNEQIDQVPDCEQNNKLVTAAHGHIAPCSESSTLCTFEDHYFCQSHPSHLKNLSTPQLHSSAILPRSYGNNTGTATWA